VDLRSSRRASRGPALVVENDGHAPCARELNQRFGVLDQPLEGRVTVAQVGDDLERQLAQLEPGRHLGVVFLRLDLQREQAAEVLAGDAGLERQVARRMVVA